MAVSSRPGGGGEVEVDRVARHRRALGEQAGRVAQRGDLLLQRARDRPRHARARGLGRDGAARGVLARELLQEERVAAARLVDLAADRPRDLVAQQRLRVGERQRAERVLDDRAVALGGRQRGRQQRPDRRGPERQREPHPPTRRAPQQVREQLQRRVVGPVQVVEDDDHRSHLRQRLQQRAHRPVRAIALVLQAGRHAPDRRQHRRQLGQLVADEPLEPVHAEEFRVLGERVLPDAERQLALELGRAAGQHQRTGGAGPRLELAEQPRLADPAFAAEGQQGAAAGRQLIECGVNGRELSAPTEQRSVEGGHSSSWNFNVREACAFPWPADTSRSAQLLQPTYEQS